MYSFIGEPFTGKLIYMDFLDPKAKRRRNIRLMIGYALTGILIVTASTILVFQAYGFDVDRKTGEVIQNGLVFVDSAPDDAAIYINGAVHKDRSNTRFTLPEGKYELVIKKDGYRDWKRTFDLHGGDVERLMYPLLILGNLEQQEIANIGGLPSFTTQSPDRRWVLNSKPGSVADFTEYDLNSVDRNTEKPRERTFTLPATLLNAAEGAHSLEQVEWSTDNKHVLIKHSFSGGFEFVVISRDAPETSLNVNQTLALNPSNVTLRDKKFDQWYLYTKDGGVLQSADAKKTITTILSGVGSFKSHDEDTLIYTQPVPNSPLQRVLIRQNNNTYLLREVGVGEAKLDIARYDDAWYVVVGSDADKKTYIYKNPLEVLDNNDDRRPAPVTILKHIGTLSWVSFSNNTRFIVAQSGQHLETYDAEHKQTYRYDVIEAFDPDTKLSWMDGHRMIVRSQKQVVIFDFDGSNAQKLVPALGGNAAFFDRDYTVLYTLNKSKSSADSYGLIRTDLRLEQDK